MPIINSGIGGSGQTIQVNELQEATAQNEGQIVEYVGETTAIPESAKVVHQHTEDPCTITVDIQTIHAVLESIEEGLSEQDLRLQFIYVNGEWFLAQAGQAFDPATVGITLDYGSGEAHVGDTFTIHHIPAGAISYVNGYFYQSGIQTIHSTYAARVASGEHYYISGVNGEQYEDYIVNTLHEELIDKYYRFAYSSADTSWTLDGSDVNLSNYGISINYEQIETINPSTYNDISYDVEGDPTLTIDLQTFEAFFAAAGMLDPNNFGDSVGFSMKYLGLDGNNQPLWVAPDGNNTTDLSQYGITVTFAGQPQQYGDGGISWTYYSKSIGEETATPQDGDTIEAFYSASYTERGWWAKKVQEINDKIDKWEEFPEPNSRNLGLIAQYIGEDEYYESEANVEYVDSYDAQVNIDVNKNQLEQAISSTQGEEALNNYYQFRIIYDAGNDVWKSYIRINDGDENEAGSYTIQELEYWGVYVSVDTASGDLRYCEAMMSYTPARIGEWRNGYFYQSTKVAEDEQFDIENVENLELDWEHPYDLDVSTYRSYIEGQGEELQERHYQLRYSDERQTSQTAGWYDENTDDEYDLSDLGVELYYANQGSYDTYASCVCTFEKFYDSRYFINKIDITKIEYLLASNHIDYINLANSITITFTCVDAENYKWKFNIGMDSIIGSGTPDDYGITIEMREPIRAPQFANGDTFTLVYSPIYTQDKENSDYFATNVYFQNYAGDPYITGIDTSTFEQEIGTLPTTATTYTWVCTSDSPVSWTLDGVAADPADYGLYLSNNRAPAYMVGDTIKMVYIPNKKDQYLVVYKDLTGSGDVESVNKETFYQYYGSIPEQNMTLNFYCTDAGDTETAKWKLFADGSSSLSEYGVNLRSSQDQHAYEIGDRIIVMYFAQPRVEIAEPTNDSRFILHYRPRSEYYVWEQKDVQPGSGDYNKLEKKPAIDGVILTSETTAQDLSGSFVDLTSDQKADGTKIINELFKVEVQPNAKKPYEGSAMHPYVDCVSYVPNGDSTVFLATGDKSNPQWYGFNVYANETPILVLLDSEGNRRDTLPLDPDVYNCISNAGYSSDKFVGGFCSNTALWTDPNDGKEYLFALTAPCLLSKYDMSAIRQGNWSSAAVSSHLLFDPYYVREYYDQFNHVLNRIRIQGNNLYAFKELDDGTTCGLYPVKYDLVHETAYSVGPGDFQGGGLYVYWSPAEYTKEGSHDYNIITENGTDYVYLYLDISSTFTDIYGNSVDYPRATIYKFPLDQSNESANLQMISYQFTNPGDDLGKVNIKKIAKIDERYLFVYAENSEGWTFFNLFDTTNDSVVDQVWCKANPVADDYTIYKQSEGVYKVSGFIGNQIYQFTIDTNNQRINERDEYVFIHESLYNQLMWGVPEYINRSCTMYMWDDVNLEQYNGYYYFTSPVYFSHRQASIYYGGYSPYAVFMGMGYDYQRYATESYVTSVLSTSGFITEDYLYNNGYATQSWCNNGNIYYTNLIGKPKLNGVDIDGSMTSQDYHIIDSYGINITETQMIMNGKGIKYDTPFQVATVIAGGGSDYDTYDVKYVIPSREENGVYYQVVNFRNVGESQTNYDVFKVNTLTGERTPLYSNTYISACRDAEAIAGTYVSEEDTLYLLAKRVSEGILIALRITNISSDELRGSPIIKSPVYEGTSGGTLSCISGGTSTLTGIFIDNCYCKKDPYETPYQNYPNGMMFVNQSLYDNGSTYQLVFAQTQYNGFVCYTRANFPQTPDQFQKLGNNIERYGVMSSGNIDIKLVTGNIVDDQFEVISNSLPQAIYNTNLVTWDDINDQLLMLSRVTASYSTEGEIYAYDGINSVSSTPIATLPTTYDGADVTYSLFVTTGDSTQHFIAVANRSGSTPVYTTSSDGINWTALAEFTAIGNATVVGIEYINGDFYTITDNGHFYSSSTFGSNNVNQLPWTTTSLVYGSASDGTSILAACNSGNYIMKYTPGVSTDWERASSTIYTSILHPSYPTPTIKYTNGKFYVFFYSDTNNAYLNDYITSDDCGESWYKCSLITSQAKRNYYSVNYYANSFSPMGFGCDNQGGVYAISWGQIYSNGVGTLNPRDYISLNTYTDTTNYGTVTLESTQVPRATINIRIDKNNTLLTQNVEDLYLGEVGFNSKYQAVNVDGRDLGINNTFKGVLLRGNANNKVYLAPAFFNPDTGAGAPMNESMDGTIDLVQSPSFPFIYIEQDSPTLYSNYIYFYNYSNYQQLSAITYLNGYGTLIGDTYCSIDPVDPKQFKNIIFRVMPTYTVTNVDIDNGGTGYEVGDRLALSVGSSARSNGAIIEITSVDPDTHAALSISIINNDSSASLTYGGNIYYRDIAHFSSSAINDSIIELDVHGTGLTVRNVSTTLRSPKTIGGLTPEYGSYVTPVIDSTSNTWKVINTTITDDDLIELRGDFDNDGGIAKIEYIDAYTDYSTNALYKIGFYCLITSGNGTVKAYKSEDFNINSTQSYITLRECSSDLSDATAGTNYSISYLAQYAFIYNTDNFYITAPAFVNFKGKITDLYDTNFMELYTSHPTNGFIVPALGNKNFRHSYTKNSDFKRYYYDFTEINAYGDNWEDGVHTVTSNYITTAGNKEVSVTFEVAAGRLKQVFSITPELGDSPLSTNTVTLVNPLDSDPVNNIVLVFDTVDLNDTSFIPSIEKYGVVKRGYRVQTAIDPTDPANTNSIATVDAIIQYIQTVLS